MGMLWVLNWNIDLSTKPIPKKWENEWILKLKRKILKEISKTVVSFGNVDSFKVYWNGFRR